MSGVAEDMATDEVARGYLELGLRLGRHIDGFVDCWFGDPALAARVAAEPPADPRDLFRDARRLRDRLSGDGGERARFLTAQLTALERTARRLAGEAVTFRTEVACYFGVEIESGDPDRYAAAHDAIAELVGGTGALPPRLEEFTARNAVPPEKLLRCVQAVSDGLRAVVAPRFDLPESEHVEYHVVEGAPWNAFNRYLGGFRSEVALNAVAGQSLAGLPVLVTHESYAGHHTEHCLKEAGLVGQRGQVEQTIALVNTPQCLMAEGAAELALDVTLGPGWGEWTSALLADEGVRVEGALVERLLTAVRELLPVRQDALLMAHDQAVDVETVIEHVRRWMLLPRERAERVVTFLLDPLWRAYTVTYVEGARLVGAWLAAGPAGRLDDRFATLLREPLLPSALRTEQV